ncbi:ORF2 [Erthesina fullo arlivirus 1]|uniref:ORF2 n=1 Tax=Erthesina fullo arlivirus 1 TaxID=2945982 RepID=UPI0024819AF7|nr:ORF2 [Erthesina fullo arlivirus 1]URA30370.1 ORF2 [Erthesina fullo arlivirus 1]
MSITEFIKKTSLISMNNKLYVNTSSVGYLKGQFIDLSNNPDTKLYLSKGNFSSKIEDKRVSDFEDPIYESIDDSDYFDDPQLSRSLEDHNLLLHELQPINPNSKETDKLRIFGNIKRFISKNQSNKLNSTDQPSTSVIDQDPEEVTRSLTLSEEASDTIKKGYKLALLCQSQIKNTNKMSAKEEADLIYDVYKDFSPDEEHKKSDAEDILDNTEISRVLSDGSRLTKASETRNPFPETRECITTIPSDYIPESAPQDDKKGLISKLSDMIMSTTSVASPLKEKNL